MSDLFSTGIRPLVDEFLTKRAAEVRDYGEYWSASSGGYCMRLNIFKRLGVPPVSEDARKQRVFSSGDIFHEWMQRLTREAGVSIAQELELQDEELMIRGHIDDLVFMHYSDVDNPETVNAGGASGGSMYTHLILYDYKTVHSNSFHYSKGRDISHYHKIQLGTYMYMLRKGVEVLGDGGIATDVSGLTEGRILRISKDDLCMEENQLLWTPALEKEIVSYWTTLNGYWNKKEIPRCTCADFEKNSKTGKGFMSDPRYNPYFLNGESCSIDYYTQWKENKDV